MLLALEQFLGDLKPAHRGGVVWDGGKMNLRLHVYITELIPPVELITSVRAVVRYGELVVLLENPDGVHFLPGGRIEAGEAFEETLKREVAEECGLTLKRSNLAGFMHFHHLTARPQGYAYPYPDFIHLVYLAESDSPDIRSGDLDGYEQSARFGSICEARNLADVDYALPFLAAVSDNS